jgi:hypothetical protein
VDLRPHAANLDAFVIRDGLICCTHLKSHPRLYPSDLRSPVGLSKVKINSIIKPHHIGAPKEEHGC